MSEKPGVLLGKNVIRVLVDYLKLFMCLYICLFIYICLLADVTLLFHLLAYCQLFLSTWCFLFLGNRIVSSAQCESCSQR